MAPERAPELATLRDKGLVKLVWAGRPSSVATFQVRLTPTGKAAARREEAAANALQGVEAIQEFERCLGRLVVAVFVTNKLRTEGNVDATMGDLSGLPIAFALWKLAQTVESAARAANPIDRRLSLGILTAYEKLCLPKCGYPFSAPDWVERLRPRIRRAAMRVVAPAVATHEQRTATTLTRGKPWTQCELGAAIRDLETKEVGAIRGLRKRAGEGRALVEARRLFGRNAIMNRFGCSAGLVSESPVWQRLARSLGIKGKRPGVGRGKKIGLEVAEGLSATAQQRELDRLAREQEQDAAQDKRRSRRT